MKAAIINLGCKVNKYESDAMKEKLIADGITVVEPEEVADVYIVNTCSVTNMAQRKSRQMLRRAKKRNPNAIIIAAGCYVNAEHDNLLQEEFVDVVVGNNRKNEIVTVVRECMKNHESLDYYVDIDKTNIYEEMGCLKAADMDHQRAYIKIQDGCNQFCSYCIIPYTRGRVRSRKPELVLEEIRQLANEGVQEFVLTGIHISSYGIDFQKEDVEYDTAMTKQENLPYLATLIKAIVDMPEVKRLRLGSLEPRIVTDEFLKVISGSDKVCPHFHLSLQSGCNETLKRMNRKYTIEEFMEKCNLLRRYFDKPAITTDVIVGFPGETEQEFEITMKHLEELKLYEIHVFKYSIRSGTVAEHMPNHVPEEVKNIRSERLLALTSCQKEMFEHSLSGLQDFVLIEERLEKCDITGKVRYTGHTMRYVKVEIESDVDITNQILSVTYGELCR